MPNLEYLYIGDCILDFYNKYIANELFKIYQMKNLYCFLLIIILFISCSPNGQNNTTGNETQTNENDKSYNKTISPDGKIESAILLHSRKGIRAELNLNKNTLDLWISPQAGKSVDNRYRNFSCRDDHSSIFDKIWFPELGRKEFVKCDYDPFHSIIHFNGQTMHLATLLDEPVVLVWFENEEVIDIKSDKQDSLLVQAKPLFGTRHPDRGLVLDYYAAIGGKDGIFQHQPEVEMHRSIYARCVIQPNQFMVIGGELSSENVRKIAERISSTELNSILSTNEKMISEATKTGSLTLKELPEMQKLYDINQRHLLSVQDASGAIHAALRYVYYLIWSTDGTVTSSSMMQTGNMDFLKLWCEYILANPTTQTASPSGRFYGQLVDKRITKREEFGSLCAVWPAFMYWGLSGDDQFVKGENLKLLVDVVDWVDRYCDDKKIGAIGTYYIGGGSEDPFLGSSDYGYDAAVGSFMDRNTNFPKYEGQPILRAYEFNMNLNQYNMYLMLSAVTEGDQSASYVRKAELIQKFLNRLDSLNAKAYYLLKDKGLVVVKRKEGDVEKGLFAIQHNAPASFMPNFHAYFMARMSSFTAFTTESIIDKYACDVYGRLAGLDPEFVSEDDIVKSLNASIPYNVKPSKFIPMPYSMVEVFGAKEGTYHDIRPQAFSTGPYQAAIVNLAVKTMPFGIALRASNYIKTINEFNYLKRKIDISYTGTGTIAKIKLNGAELNNTLQIPDNLLVKDKNKIEIVLDKNVNTTPQLVYSTVRLLSIKNDGSNIKYNIQGYCQNVLIFKNVKENPVVKSKNGNIIQPTFVKDGIYLFVEFFGKDNFIVEFTE